jgi:hypothetical protein
VGAITKISLMMTWESCERTTYYIVLTNDEGFTLTPDAHRTGSIYTNHEGLTKEEARDRALIDAHNWSDFLQIPFTPYVEEDVVYEPSMTFNSFTMRREMQKRKQKQ